MAKKVVRAEVYGNPPNASESSQENCCVSFQELLDRMEKRHDYYHEKPLPDDFPVDVRTGLKMGGRNIPKEDHVCLKYVLYSRKMCEGFDWA